MSQLEPDARVIKDLWRQIFGAERGLRVTRVTEGVSTYVFRVERADQVFYLRVLPEDNASFAPEVRAHALLREHGVRVPEVIYWEHYNSVLDRSLMVTTQIKGHAIGHGAEPGGLRDVLIAAGRDIALCNTIPVRDFGWIKRDQADVDDLEGEVATLRAWALGDLDQQLALLLDHGVFPSHMIRRIGEVVVAAKDVLDDEQAYLAHGDFDSTHIYHDQAAYTGIIDWGEIRGAQQLYDLAHLNVHDAPMFPYVLQGYREVVPLPDDFERRIQLGSLLIPLGRLANGLRKRPTRPPFAPYVAAVERAVAALSV